MVDLMPDALVVEAPATMDLVVMNVRVFSQQGETVFSEQSVGEVVVIPFYDLPDGSYGYESVSVISKGQPEDEKTLRSYGRFEIVNGVLVLKSDNQRESVGMAEPGRVSRLLGGLLDLLVPQAQAADVDVSDDWPWVKFNDTDGGSNIDWALAFDLVFGYSLLDVESSTIPFNILPSVNNDRSFEIDLQGDINLANGAFWVERTGDVGIGTTNPDTLLHLSAGVPRIQLFDETNNTRGALIYNSNTLALEGNSYQNVIWFRQDSPADSLSIETSGDLNLADGRFYFDRAAGATNTERLGIGTTAPAASIHVSENIPALRLTDESSGDSAEIRFDANQLQFLSPVTPASERIMSLHRDAPPNSLLVSNLGLVGMGVLTPQQPLHMSAAIPRIQLDNETNNRTAYLLNNASLFVVEGDQSQQNILNLHLSAPQNSVFVDSNGWLGLNTGTPGAPLHVRRTGGTAQILVEEANGIAAPRTLFKLSNRGNTKFEIEELVSGNNWGFTNSGDDFRVSLQGSGDIEFRIENGGDAHLKGVLFENSDRNAKTEIRDLDEQAILERVRTLDIARWQYKDTPNVDHIGPMAQDFHAAFGLGKSDTSIATLDTAGVALASIQALAAKDTEQEAHNQLLLEQNHQLRAQNLSLEQRLHELEQLVGSLVASKPGRLAAN